MQSLDQYSLDELKLVYRLLQQGVTQHPDLMDSELLQDLQTWLQQQASRDGVDVSLHAQWSAWLNNGVSLTGI